MTELFDLRPIIVAIAGPNGAGKSTFHEVFVRQSGLRFINADDIALALNMGAYDAAELAERMRDQLVGEGESFVLETVFSDPHGEKVSFLRDAVSRGFTVVLCFIGLDSAATSDDRVAMRVLQGGHDVPTEKLVARYQRSLVNLKRAIRTLPFVRVYDNSDLGNPFRKVAEYKDGTLTEDVAPLPDWLTRLLADAPSEADP